MTVIARTDREVIDALWTEFHVYDDHASDGFGETREECIEFTCRRIRDYLAGHAFERDDRADKAAERLRHRATQDPLL